MSSQILSLFEGYGIEIEYAIVDHKTLNIKAIADEVIYALAGKYDNEVVSGDIVWSNELMLHVIELKTNGPAKTLQGLSDLFHHDVKKINKILEKQAARLMPTASHPWMIPNQDAKLWPHGDDEIYEAYDDIFDCSGHGWSNLQSVHLNLPFANDAEFECLHAAIRLILPILPALCASSPLIEGKTTGFLDTRLKYYLENQKTIASITGKLVPEAIFSPKEYKKNILERMYQDVAFYDKRGLIQEEWLNSRGAIPRFDRQSIEIRILDSQEAPVADIAIIEIIVAMLKCLIQEGWLSLKTQKTYHEDGLYHIFKEAIRLGSRAMISNSNYLKVFGYSKTSSPISIKELWLHILESLQVKGYVESQAGHELARKIVEQGNLSERILKSLNGSNKMSDLKSVYQQLCDCLNENRPFYLE